MKCISIFFIFFILNFNISISFAQKIECSRIEFSFYPAAEQVEEAGIKVKAFLKVDDLKNDTITLKTNVKISLFGPKNLKANLIDKKGNLSTLTSWIDSPINSQQSESYQFMKILIPNKRNATILITYNVLGSSIFKYSPESESFYTCQQQYEYYYPMDMPIREIKVSSSDSIKYFASYKKENKELKDINLSFIHKGHYKEKSFAKGNLKINLHIPDSLINDQRMQKNIVDFQQYIDKLSTHLSSQKSADLIYINWRDDQTRRAFGEALGDYTVCDINFNSKDLLHELIHIFFPIDVKQNSKGEYFMKESIIEWLALYFSNKNKYIDKVGGKSTNSISLYDVQINNLTTWNLIYITGPLIIQQISSKSGEDKMANIIISFLKKNQNNTISYGKFIAYVKKYLSNDLVEEMNFLIKNSY